MGAAVCAAHNPSHHKKEGMTFGQLLDWRSYISAIIMSDGAPVAMKYDELAWEQLVAQIEARSHSADTKSLYELNGSILVRAKQAVEKGMQKPQATATKPGKETRQQPQQNWNGSRRSSWGSKPWAQREGHAQVLIWKECRWGSLPTARPIKGAPKTSIGAASKRGGGGIKES